MRESPEKQSGRRVRAVLLALALALLLSACGVLPSPAQTPRPAPSPEPTETPEPTVPPMEIPEGTPLIEYTQGEDARFRAELEAALRERPAEICIKDKLLFNMQDLFRLDYGSFWVESCLYAYRKDRWVDGGQEIYCFYGLEYYDLSDADIARMKAEIDAAAAELLAPVPAGADAWTASKLVHDGLCRRITYDHSLELPHTHDLYGALVLGEAVCSAYSSAFTFLMERLGFVTEPSYSDDHAWNSVDVPSLARYVDATWDDTDLYDRYGRPYIQYDYFFLEFGEVQQIDDHAFSGYEPIYDYHGHLEPYNYFEHEGLLLTVYDREEILRLLSSQYARGDNLLTLRFRYEGDYQRALQWFGEDRTELHALLGELGYTGAYYYWHNDVVRTVSLGLYAPEG